MSDDAKDQSKAAAVFREVVALLEESPYDYAVGGGICTDHWINGAKSIADIDLLIREADAVDIMKLLSGAGYETEQMDHSWLNKAFKDGVTIDLMHELKNGTTFDTRFKQHRKREELFGTVAYVMAPEDQVASLAGTCDRQTIGQHWYSIVDIMSNNDLEWDYVIARAQRIPFRMLSVIYYALAEQVPVQKGVIEQLSELIGSRAR